MDAIVERLPAPVVTDRIPVPGKWEVQALIPSRHEYDYGDAMEAALTLLAEIGTRPDHAYLVGGYCVLELGLLDFSGAEFRAEQIRSWLLGRGYELRFLGSDDWTPLPSDPEGEAYLRLIQNKSLVPYSGDWALSIEIPEKSGGMASARELASYLDITPDDSGWISYKIGNFEDAKKKTTEAIQWLTEKYDDIETSWGDAGLRLHSLQEEPLRSLNDTARYRLHRNSDKPMVTLEDSRRNYLPEWSSRLQRIAALADGPADRLPLKLKSNEVRVLLDMAAENCAHCDGIGQFSQLTVREIWPGQVDWGRDFEHARKAGVFLEKITTRLAAALDAAKNPAPQDLPE
jgi:hypothetical protein